jgi:hypothetical protein
VAVYFIVEIIKTAVGGSEKFKRFIPLVSAALGIVCGVVCYYAIPSIMPASNVVVAIIIGGASGLSATGTNQIIKQLTDKTNDSESEDKGEDDDGKQ